MSSCCTFRLKRRRAFSRDSPSCSRISAKETHPQTRPEGPVPRLLGPDSYYKELTGSQVGRVEKAARSAFIAMGLHGLQRLAGEERCLDSGREYFGPS